MTVICSIERTDVANHSIVSKFPLIYIFRLLTSAESFLVGNCRHDCWRHSALEDHVLFLLAFNASLDRRCACVICHMVPSASLKWQLVTCTKPTNFLHNFKKSGLQSCFTTLKGTAAELEITADEN